MKFNLMFLASCILFFQCQEKNETGEALPVIIIDHDKKEELSLRDFASDYREIPLEMTENSTIQYINDIAVSDEHLYIDDVKNGVLQCNKDGNFIKVIGKKAEEGPETYATPTSIAFDEEEKAIIIADTYRFKLYKFNLEGRLIGETEKLPVEPIFVKSSKDGYWAVAEEFVTDGSGNSRFYREAEIYRLDKDLEILNKFTADHLSLKSAWGAPRRQPSLLFYSENDSLNYFYNPILLPSRAYSGKFDRDTLYQVQEEGLIPKVRFAFSRAIWDGEKKIFHLRKVMAYKQYYLVSYEYRSSPYLFIYDRSTKEGKVVQEGLSLPGLEEKFMPYSKSNGQMYLMVQRPPEPGKAEPNPSIILF
ncbi:6-bladed beta-propeller [Echinicola marina]|uniref:6-bladed beta-propeller n=1 Tax=Echinicola marina TaxID=2859768 RepID=UPI001CF64BEB|nr:6-bladed beta-propeller [Echinicola marina]UCS95331.1 6-bladed beta-propeller [Echinicola marina]